MFLFWRLMRTSAYFTFSVQSLRAGSHGHACIYRSRCYYRDSSSQCRTLWSSDQIPLENFRTSSSLLFLVQYFNQQKSTIYREAACEPSLLTEQVQWKREGLCLTVSMSVSYTFIFPFWSVLFPFSCLIVLLVLAHLIPPLLLLFCSWQHGTVSGVVRIENRSSPGVLYQDGGWLFHSWFFHSCRIYSGNGTLQPFTTASVYHVSRPMPGTRYALFIRV